MIIAFPVLMYMASVGTSFQKKYPLTKTHDSITQATGIIVLYQAARPDATLWTHLAVNFGLPYFVITISLNVIISTIIAIRLFIYRYRMREAFPGDSSSSAPYASIAGLLIESSALYAIASILFIAPYAVGSHLSFVFLPILVQVQVRLPFSVFYYRSLNILLRRLYLLYSSSCE